VHQGPYIFTHYNTTLSLPIPTISLLFTTSFLSAALSSLFTGRVADRYGRSRACIVFCILYFLSCLSVLCPYFPILFIGRVLGGISTTLLFSVFEAWMIAEFKTKSLERIVKIEEVFRDVAMLGSVTAIAAGLVGEMVKGYFGTTSAPFVLAAACLVTAGVGIYVFWVRISFSLPPLEKEEKVPH
jgi:MFS family permease